MFSQEYRTELFYHQCQKRLNTILETPQTMYHYTNAEVLKSIIENKCLYATHINFMNDWEEYEIGYEMLTGKIKEMMKKYRNDFKEKIGIDNLEEIEKYFSDKCLNVTNYSEAYKKDKFKELRAYTMPEVFTISFCKEKDLLSQWTTYAKESGVAIEFDFSNFIFCDASLDEKDADNYMDDEWQEIKYYRYNRPHIINYKAQEVEEKLEEQIVEVVRAIKDPHFGATEEIRRPIYLIRKMAELYTVVPYCKLDKFKAENEIRVAFMRLERWIEGTGGHKERYKTKIFYRVADHVLKPFLKIGWEAQIPDTYPIKKIIVGPGKNQEVVYRGIIHFIENQDVSLIPNKIGMKPFSNPVVDESYLTCKGIVIQKSNIPYIF